MLSLKRKDVETCLHYNRFRYYDSDAGRFISHDPIGLLGGDNNFHFAPNPVEWVDVFGLSSKPSRGYNSNYDKSRDESFSNKPMKAQDAIDDWDNFLCPNTTNIDPRDGLPDLDRIWSADGKRSIRYGEHEMSSSVKKNHYHKETWDSNFNVTSVVVRILYVKPKKP